MRISNISYTTDDPARDYAAVLDQCSTLMELKRAVLKDWRELAPDALKIVALMSDDDFREFKEGMQQERKGTYAGDEWSKKYNAVVMPELMFEASLLAVQFHVPWGLAFIRLRDKRNGGE